MGDLFVEGETEINVIHKFSGVIPQTYDSISKSARGVHRLNS